MPSVARPILFRWAPPIKILDPPLTSYPKKKKIQLCPGPHNWPGPRVTSPPPLSTPLVLGYQPDTFLTVPWKQARRKSASRREVTTRAIIDVRPNSVVLGGIMIASIIAQWLTSRSSHDLCRDSLVGSCEHVKPSPGNRRHFTQLILYTCMFK